MGGVADGGVEIIIRFAVGQLLLLLLLQWRLSVSRCMADSLLAVTVCPRPGAARWLIASPMLASVILVYLLFSY